MSKPLVVQKYGGTSLGTLERIEYVADRIAKLRKTGINMVIVVSAMAGETDKLLKMARTLSKNPERREIDMLLSSGERISAALLALALQNRGIPALSMTGRQVGLQTDSTHTRARITSIDIRRASEMIQEGYVIVVAGFQGINPQGDVTTLVAADMTDTQLTMEVDAIGSLKALDYLDLEGEEVQIEQVDGNNLVIKRGMDNTTATVHVKGSPVKYIDQAVEREYIPEGDDFGFDGTIS